MERAAVIEAIANERRPWDLVVIGGGASGFGAAVDAASRGLRVLLLEQEDFGKGTSSRSTKLVHGGVRYLKQGRIGLVRESLHERGLLLRNAPHVTSRLAFVVPSYRSSDTLMYGVGLKVYDMLAGNLSLGNSKVLSAREVAAELPTIATRGLRAGIRYYDGQFDDARLIVTLGQTLFDLGGMCLNHAPVLEILKSNRRVAGVVLRNSETDREYSVRCRAIINATGVFSDSVRRLDDTRAEPIVTVSQGVHLVFDRSFLPTETALMIPQTTDGRVLFAIPWQDHLLVGTTDTPDVQASMEPRPLDQEIAFILENAKRYLAKAPSHGDILSAFAGLRPLVAGRGAKRTADVSRGYTLDISETGMVTLAGGKWTTYRKMGEAAVDAAIGAAGLERKPSKTTDLRLHGAGALPPASYPKHWFSYGTDVAAVSALCNENARWREPLHPGLPHLKGEVIWAVRAEMARTVEDVLARRTRILFLNARAAMEAAPTVAELLATELRRDDAWRAAQVRDFKALAQGYLPN